MAAPAFADKGTAGNTATADNVNVTAPATVNANDILVILALTKDNIEINTPTGFSQDATNAARNQGANLRAEWFWKRADGTEDGSTINVSRASGTANLLFAQIYRFTGCVTSGDPYEAAAMTGANSATVTPTDITTLGVDRLMVALTATEDDIITIGNFTGGTATVTEAAEDATATGTDGNLHAATVARTTAETFDYGTQTLSVSRQHSVFTFALVPPAAGSTVTFDAAIAGTGAVTAAVVLTVVYAVVVAGVGAVVAALDLPTGAAVVITADNIFASHFYFWA